MTMNKVIAGDYDGYSVKAGRGSLTFTPPFFSQHNNIVDINKNTVRSYRIVTDDHRKSAVSGIVRGVIGEYFFGNAGMIGGTLSAKNTAVYIITVEFFNGRRSLIEVDDKKYKALIRSIF